MIGPECPSRQAISDSVAKSHNRIVLSQDPEANRPSGRTQTAVIQLECPARQAVSAPVDRSQIRSVLSEEADRSRPSSSKQSALTELKCPSKRAASAPGGARLGPIGNDRRRRNEPVGPFDKAFRADQSTRLETFRQLKR